MPSHSHLLSATTTAGNGTAATGAQLAKGFKGNIQSSIKANMYSAAGSPQPNATMSPQALTPAGSSFPHNNMMPFLTLNFCIALQGIFPPRG
jgi:microcystin-dependent protein